MYFQSMDYFVTTARERSFTKAAQKLHITQQTLSAHIAMIEKELGCQLFIRHIPLELTYAGDIFLRYALNFQKQYCSMQRTFSDISQQYQGILRIGVPHTRGRVIMPKLIAAFQKSYPKIEIQVIEDTNDNLAEKLFGAEVDIAIADFPERMPGMQLMDFYKENVVLLISEILLHEIYGADTEKIIQQVNQSGNIAPLQECPFLMNHEHDIAGKFAQSLLRKANFHPVIKAQSENIELLLDLCLRNIGACFCSEMLAQTVLSAQQLEKLTMFHFDENAEFMIRLGWMENSDDWIVRSAFLNSAKELYTK